MQIADTAHHRGLIESSLHGRPAIVNNDRLTAAEASAVLVAVSAPVAGREQDEQQNDPILLPQGLFIPYFLHFIFVQVQHIFSTFPIFETPDSSNRCRAYIEYLS